MPRADMINTRESGRTSTNYFPLIKKLFLELSATILIIFLEWFRFVYQNFKKHMLKFSTSWINKNETKTKRLLQDMSSSCSRTGSHSGSHSRSHGNLFHRVGCPFVCALECYRCRPWESNARRGSAIGVTGSGPGPAAQVCKSQICLLWEFVGGVWLGKVFECECVLCGGNSLSSFCLVWILLKLWKLWAVRLRVIRKSKGVT